MFQYPDPSFVCWIGKNNYDINSDVLTSQINNNLSLSNVYHRQSFVVGSFFFTPELPREEGVKNKSSQWKMMEVDS